jgi:hypothetical protein
VKLNDLYGIRDMMDVYSFNSSDEAPDNSYANLFPHREYDAKACDAMAHEPSGMKKTMKRLSSTPRIKVQYRGAHTEAPSTWHLKIRRNRDGLSDDLLQA